MNWHQKWNSTANKPRATGQFWAGKGMQFMALLFIVHISVALWPGSLQAA
jgi:hypothetical protein